MTPHLLAGGEKGWVLQKELPSKGPSPTAQRAAPGGRQGCASHPQLPNATFSFPDQAGRDGGGNSRAQAKVRKGQVSISVPTGNQQSLGSRVCRAGVLRLDHPLCGTPQEACHPWHGPPTPGVRVPPGPALLVHLPLLRVNFVGKLSPPWAHTQHLPSPP